MKKLFGLFLLFAASQTFAGAVYTIGFGDTTDQFIMDYKGFYWSGSYNGTDLNSHWVNAQCCGNNPPDIPNAPLGYAWSNGATDILDFESKDTSAFNFLSFDIYGDTNLHGGRSEPIAVKGFLDDILLYSVVLPALDTLSRTAFTTFDLNWAGINNVQYHSEYLPDKFKI